MALSGAAQAADTVSGPARATAPETLVVANVRIRFEGFTAPAPNARCGDASCADKAVARLTELAATGPVTCRRGARAGHGVYAGTCQLADGRDPARILADEGLLQPAH
jgi:endonuclease YncB( thermonuclease family)